MDKYSEILKDDDILLIYTDMDNKINNGFKITDFNYLEVSAAQWLVDHKIKCVGIDTFSMKNLGKRRE